MTLEANDVVSLYQMLLGREPESQDVIEFHRQNASYADLVAAIAGSPEFGRRTSSCPYWWYNSEIDALRIIETHEDKQRVAKDGHSVNYLGVAVDVDRFFPGLGIENGLDEIPIPKNWHADISEFAAALRAVELSGDRFTMVELGCGWGCWMNNTGVAARRLGKKVMLIGVEGDEDHVGFAQQSMATNGFQSSEYRIVRGVAAARAGVALFPRQEVAGTTWGSEPIFDASPGEIERLTAAGEYDRVAVVALADVIAADARVDLLHIDIQGGEADLIEHTLDVLADKVAYIVIGTHSREIEGRLIKDLLGAGWALEIERPCVFELEDGRPVTTVDGVQGWRNRNLLSIAS